ncbi:DNA polymerase [Devosia sp. Root413D1]|uniref:error-prone DNA polymerase n=1 Tax=Devosia sp. Root413D1 TaxID=1736531 RepID=UPI0006F925F7|nr:error-prone DNA polymerase [Devosia sp. Root413D1]KQW85822.1 DNA polymerase [Devosia sp. Root413D1]
MSRPSYAELMVTSNFSFLRSGSHPEELVSAAIALGMSGVGICDRNSFAGVVRGYVAHRDLKHKAPDFRYVVGVRLCFADDTPDIIAYPSDREAYGRLCRMLSRGNLREESEKGKCVLSFADLEDFIEGQLLILHCDETRWEHSGAVLERLAKLSPGNVWLAAATTFKGTDRARLNRLAAMAAAAKVPLLAVNDVLYHEPNRKIVQDVVTCIREHLTLETAGRRLQQNAERHLKPASEMTRLFAEHPDAIAETQVLLGRIGFSLDQLKYNYPTETIGNGETAQETLERLTWEGAHWRYPDGIPDSIKQSLWSELCLIAYKGYASYFLTVEDVVRYARHELKILCQGRGSAANSAVCYCLGVTEVDPTKVTLVFGRFLSTERDEPPDIDVDFEHERREEVMQYVYAKYGGERTGLTATVISYRSKSAIRETAKVFGISDDTIGALNQLHWGWGNAADLKGIKMLGLDPDDPTLTQMFNVVPVLKSFPRHLSQHVGGFVITRDSLESLVPISKTAMESRTIVEWDKDDIDALGILKVDILALGMLTCLRRSFELLHQHYDRDVTLPQLMAEETQPQVKAPVYRMTHRADTIGVFQIESRAQMSMLPRLKPVEFYDLVIEVAIVRPGPIQGGMVHPYLKRRQGLEKIEPMPPDLYAVMKRTYGVPLFQEQAMQIAIVAAGFTPGEADKLRRAMATFRRNGTIHTLKDRFLSGMKTNGYAEDFARRCFAQIEGFGDYGFPESHAASFALLVYASCWMKCHYPDVFACALLNSQPMGFYSPAQIVRDAVEHGVEMRVADVNRSDWLHVLETGVPARERIAKQHAEMRDDILSTKAIRLGLRQVIGLKQDHANLIVARRGDGYASIRDLWVRTGIPVATLEKLAEADAFGSLGLNRREALWVVRGLNGVAGAEQLPLFAISKKVSKPDDAESDLPVMAPGESVVHDYRTLSLSLKGHPVGFLRPELERRGILRCADLIDKPNGAIVETAGLVLVRQQPGTASGVIFMTLEDETGIANIIVWNKTFDKNRRVVLGSRLLAVRGQLQREGLVTHLVSRSFTDFTPSLLDLAQGLDIGNGVLAHGDEGRTGPQPGRDEGERRRREQLDREAYAALPSGRNFH